MNMKLNRTSYALLIALAGTVAFAGCKKDNTEDMAAPPAASEPMTETTPAPAPMEPAAPVATTSVTVGNTAAADKSVASVSTFAPSDKIIVSVNTQAADAANANIDAKLTYQDGQVAAQKSAAGTADGMGTTNIEFSNDKPWPAGTYKVDVMVNGQPAGMTQQIEVK